MTNSEIFFLIGRCLSLDQNPDFKNILKANCSADLIDWQRFVHICSNHYILPVIYLKFHSHGITEFIPNELLLHLLEIYDLNVKRNQQILKQLNEITAILCRNGIHPIFLKGTGNLLDGLYSDIGERILGDIDFLVPEEDYLPAAKLLEMTGYLMVEAFPEYDDIKNQKHYPRLYHPKYPAIVEIHRIPVNVEYVGWFNTELIDCEKRSVESIPGCFVQSDKHKIIQNFIHSQLSNEGYLFARVSLREFYDLYLLSKRSSVSDSLTQIKAKKRAVAYFAYAKKVMDLNDTFFNQKNLFYFILSRRHILNLNSRVFHFISRNLIFLTQRILEGYFGLLVQAIYSRQKRQYIIRRIKNREWYGDHIKLYTDFFKGNR